MSRGAVGALVAVLTVVGLLVGMIGIAALDDEDKKQAQAVCSPTDAVSVSVDNLPDVPGFTKTQVRTGAIIANAGEKADVGERGQLVGIMVGEQESQLGEQTQATGVGDAGTFQQRTLKGWYGSMKQVMDPAYASKVFFEGKTASKPGDYGTAGGGSGYGHIPGLKDIAGWESMPLTVAAQRVQRSGYPEAYAPHEKRARTLLAALSKSDVDVSQASDAGSDQASANCAGGSNAKASGDAKNALDRAQKMKGRPYVFGSGDKNGPTKGDGLDCSGLVLYSYGLEISDLGRTAQEMHDSLAAHKVDVKDIQPGDLIFYAYGRTGPAGDPGSVSHVAIYEGDNRQIEAIRGSLGNGVTEGPSRLHGKAFIGIARIPSSDKEAS